MAKATKKTNKKSETSIAGVDMGLGLDDFLNSYITDLEGGDVDSFEQEPLSTGIIPLDILLSGGIRDGDMMMVYSPPGLGKTTITLQLARKMIDLHNKRVLFIDLEAGIKNMLQSFGMIPYWKDGKFSFTDRLSTIGHLEKLLEGIVKQDDPKYDFIIIDSITNAIDDTILTRSVLDPMMAGQAKSLTLFLQKFRVLLREKGITTILVNQERANLEARSPYDKKTKAAGCKALHYQPDVIIGLKKLQDIKVKKQTINGLTDTVIGVDIIATADKNRKGFSKVPIVFPMLAVKGISNVLFVTKLLKDKGFVKQAGAYFKTNIIPNPNGEEWSLQGLAGLSSWVDSNFDAINEYLLNQGAYVLVEEDENEEEDILDEI